MARRMNFKACAMLVISAGATGCRAFSVSAQRAVVPSVTSKLGFSFTPGGLLFPYHLGVAKCLEREGFLAADTPVSGSSAGALAAAVVGAGLDIDVATELAARVFKDCREGGAAFRLKGIVERGLDGSLPDNAHEIINEREGQVTIGITHLFPRPKGVFIHEFESREDLIEVLLGSCHVPFWFSSYPYMKVRGKATVDGLFSMPYNYVGSPGVPTADQVVRVTAFPTTTLRMYTEREGDIISPDLLDRYKDGRFLEMLNYAANPGSDEAMTELFKAGYESGGVWYSKFGDIFRERHEEKYVL